MKRFRKLYVISILLAMMLFTCSCSGKTNAVENIQKQLQPSETQKQENLIPYGHYVPNHLSASNNKETLAINNYQNTSSILEFKSDNLDNPQILQQKYYEDMSEGFYNLNIWDDKYYFSHYQDGVYNLFATDLDTGESSIIAQNNEFCNFIIYNGIVFGDYISSEGLLIKTWDLDGNFLESYLLEDYSSFMWIPYKDHIIWITNYDNAKNKEVFTISLDEKNSTPTKVGEIKCSYEDPDMYVSFAYYNDELYITNKQTTYSRGESTQDGSHSFLNYENTETFYKLNEFQENGLEETDLLNGIVIEGAYACLLSNGDTLAFVVYDDQYQSDIFRDFDNCSVFKYDQNQKSLFKLYDFDYDSFSDPEDFSFCITKDSVLVWSEKESLGYQISLDPEVEPVTFSLNY